MSAHAEIVRDYVALRNFLARSNPKPNMQFEIVFEFQDGFLLAKSSVGAAKVRLAKVNVFTSRLLPISEQNMFDVYSSDLIQFVNSQLRPLNSGIDEILEFTINHKRSLGLKIGYEP